MAGHGTGTERGGGVFWGYITLVDPLEDGIGHPGLPSRDGHSAP